MCDATIGCVLWGRILRSRVCAVGKAFLGKALGTCQLVAPFTSWAIGHGSLKSGMFFRNGADPQRLPPRSPSRWHPHSLLTYTSVCSKSFRGWRGSGRRTPFVLVTTNSSSFTLLGHIPKHHSPITAPSNMWGGQGFGIELASTPMWSRPCAFFPPPSS